MLHITRLQIRILVALDTPRTTYELSRILRKDFHRVRSALLQLSKRGIIENDRDNYLPGNAWRMTWRMRS